MLLNHVAEGRFSAIAASFNITFERDSPRSGRAPQLYVEAVEKPKSTQ